VKAPPQAPNPNSKNQQKKAKKKAEREANQDKFLAERLERRKEQRARKVAGTKRKIAEAEATEDPTEKERLFQELRASSRNGRRRRQNAQDLETAPRVVIDLQYDSLMPDKDIKSLCKQIRFCYAANARIEKPLQLHLTSIGPRIKSQLLDKDGADTWRGVECHEKVYTDLFSRKEIVYLTAESDEVVDEIDPECVYIIGGLVDRNKHKGISHEKAAEAKVHSKTNYIEMMKEIKDDDKYDREPGKKAMIVLIYGIIIEYYFKITNTIQNT